MTSHTRTPDHPIASIFVERWSPRSFSGEPVPDSVLASAFEAARWAPSAFNLQPWRFIVVRPGDERWDAAVAVLAERNRLWAHQAGALVIVLSQHEAEVRGTVSKIGSHSFDAGAAWASFALQALLLGWHSHGIGGFDREAARTAFAIPADYAIEAVVALGRKAPVEDLPPDFQALEQPNGRRPITESVFTGTFGRPAFAREGITA